jgi:hypothetical protein
MEGGDGSERGCRGGYLVVEEPELEVGTSELVRRLVVVALGG